jgi:hypothetical protein
LSASASSSSNINLSWVDNSDNETGFDIERSLNGSTWSLITTVASNVSSYANSGLTASTTYYYRVRAKNTAGNSSYTNTASATTQAGGSTPVTITFRDGLNGYSGTQDSYVASGRTGNNYGTSTALEADGSDGSNGELVTLIKWNTSSIPTNAAVTSAKVTLRVSNVSSGAYNLYARNGSAWSESTVTWANASIAANQGTLIGSFTPSSTGLYTLTLNAAGLALVQGWVNGTVANNGLTIRTAGTTNGVIVRSSEYGTSSQRPALSVTYQ